MTDYVRVLVTEDMLLKKILAYQKEPKCLIQNVEYTEEGIVIQAIGPKDIIPVLDEQYECNPIVYLIYFVAKDPAATVGLMTYIIIHEGINIEIVI